MKKKELVELLQQNLETKVLVLSTIIGSEVIVKYNCLGEDALETLGLSTEVPEDEEMPVTVVDQEYEGEQVRGIVIGQVN